MDDRDNQRPDHIVSFGPFRLFAAERLLKKGDEPVLLGGRSLDVLITLVERAGEVVTRKELISHVWPDVTVEEANLRVQVNGLRKALGEGREDARYVVNVPGRGYSFVAPVSRFTPQPSPPSIQTAVSLPLANLPARLRRMVGRDDTVHLLSTQLMMSRFVSIIGPGGMGKTTVAVAVAHALLSGFGDAVFFVDLAPISDPQLVPATVALALGFMWQTQDPLAGLLAFVSDKKILLVLDNCEHVVDVAATLAERVVNETPQAHVIATSREALRAEGEHVYLLRALDCPPEDAALTATEVLSYPAAQLFMERAAAGGYGSTLNVADALIVARICRRLDGIPLAIELAASRTAAHGIGGIEALLQNRFGLLWQGRRTALPRHQTLKAMLDWSYNLLAAHEKSILRRLSVFVGDFVLQSARTVVSDLDQDDEDAVLVIDSLVAKSLISTSTINGSIWYRLADTTRSYALKSLEENGERNRLARRHAEYYCNLFQRAEAELGARPISEWLAEHKPRLDNLRGALDWAFSPEGDASIGVALTAAAVPLWMQLSLLAECRGRLEKALAALQPGANRDARREMKLHAALAASLRYTRGAVSETGAAWTKALEIAESLEDPEYQLRALWGLWFFHTTNSRHRVALDLAQRLCTLAERWPDPNDRLIGERAMSISQHYLGDQSKARRHIERVLVDYVIADARPHLIRFQIDLRVMARVFFARVLWLQGFPDEAMRAAERSVEDARAANHAISLCYALFLGACPIALSVGDLVAAEHYGSMLLDHSARFALTFWAARGRSYQGALVIKRGDVDTGLPLLRAGFDELGEARSAVFGLIELLMPEALGRAGQIAEGLAAIEEAINHSENTEERWMIAEMLRIKGELLLLQGGPTAAAAAEDHFRQALDWAARQGALSWELRAAMSLAGLLRDQGRSADAKTLLQPVFARFTEGFETIDLKASKALLDGLR
jgi:predicted ATPase/DNA-binding winged helix-turn-helix (wHTH) protein